MFKGQVIRHSYQFLNKPSIEWHSWKVDDDGPSILSELVVKMYNRNRMKHCVIILLVARRQVIMMISTEAFSMSVTWMRISFE